MWQLRPLCHVEPKAQHLREILGNAFKAYTLRVIGDSGGDERIAGVGVGLRVVVMLHNARSDKLPALILHLSALALTCLALKKSRVKKKGGK